MTKSEIGSARRVIEEALAAQAPPIHNTGWLALMTTVTVVFLSLGQLWLHVGGVVALALVYYVAVVRRPSLSPEEHAAWKAALDAPDTIQTVTRRRGWRPRMAFPTTWPRLLRFTLDGPSSELHVSLAQPHAEILADALRAHFPSARWHGTATNFIEMPKLK